MRILHTSDWHFGRSLGEHRLLEHQAAFGDWLVDVVRAESIDLVVVAGDLFDRSVPPADAWELLWDTFRRVAGAGARVAAIAGNHDSADRLGATDGLTDLAGIYLRGGFAPASAVTTVDFADGPLALVTVPFLDPHMAPSHLVDRLSAVTPPGDTDDTDGPTPPDAPRPLDLSGAALRSGRRLTHERVLSSVLDTARAALPGGRSLVVSHAFVTGARPCDSERDLAVGEAGMVSAEVYRGFDYVALGHLHRPQTVGAAQNVRYSGSPLRYSFSETGAKQVVLVDMATDGTVRAEPLDVGVGRGVCTLKGELDSLCAGPGNHTDWVRAELTDDVRPLDSARRLRENFPWLSEVEWVGARVLGGPGVSFSEARTRRPAELAVDFWVEVTGSAPEAAVAELLAEALAAPASAEEAAA